MSRACSRASVGLQRRSDSVTRRGPSCYSTATPTIQRVSEVAGGCSRTSSAREVRFPGRLAVVAPRSGQPAVPERRKPAFLHERDSVTFTWPVGHFDILHERDSVTFTWPVGHFDSYRRGQPTWLV